MKNEIRRTGVGENIFILPDISPPDSKTVLPKPDVT
jgi:hypothetical protein